MMQYVLCDKQGNELYRIDSCSKGYQVTYDVSLRMTAARFIYSTFDEALESADEVIKNILGENTDGN